jgi:putative DNA methylase
MELYESAIELPRLVIFDPFMGSGTTIGEAHKLGCTAIGRDINPVAWRIVKTALQPIDKTKLLEMFAQLERDVAPMLLELHRGKDSSHASCDVLYWFWVKQLDCPSCATTVDLFSGRVFAKHAYVQKFPTVQVICRCGEVFCADNRATTVTCPGCRSTFDPHVGSVSGAAAACENCGHRFVMAEVARASGGPPRHRLYAKLVLRPDGEKEYLRATNDDLDSYESAKTRLREMKAPLPRVRIEDGHNTRQVLNYGYTTWDQFFNERQLLGITLLAAGISKLAECPERDALLLLLAGVLEFNNMFASYKGEGTGAVRHMFSHHALKPERTPIEANLWGTSKSSGSFSNLFKRRLLKAVDYKGAPFELVVDGSGSKPVGRKLFGKSRPMGSPVLDRWPAEGLAPRSIYLSRGDSSSTDLPDQVVDAIVTDPPFYDNVHYSELADFFHVWHRLWFGGEQDTTRNLREVQDTDSERFAAKLRSVFAECHRVLKDDGLLVFSYHHSRDDGWLSVAAAVLHAGFRFVAAQPVKAEMAVATPKLAAKSPIDLDVMLVCRKASVDTRTALAKAGAHHVIEEASATKIGRFNSTGRRLSLNDVKVVVLSQALVELCAGRSADEALEMFAGVFESLRAIAERLFEAQQR